MADAVNDAGAASMDSGAPKVARSADNISATSNGGSRGSGMRGEATLPVGIRQPLHVEVREYTKQYRVRISAAEIDVQKVPDANSNFNNDAYRIAFEHHDLPVAHNAFYLSDGEMRSFKDYTSVEIEECAVDVYSETAIVPFNTNVSTSGVGNNNVGQKLSVYSSEMEKYRVGCYDNSQFQKCVDVFWQANITTGVTPTLTAGSLGAQHVIKDFDNRFYYETRTHGSDILIDVFPVQRYVTKRINASMEEGPLTSWRYKPKNGYIYGNNRTGGDALSLSQANRPYIYVRKGLVNSQLLNGRTGLAGTPNERYRVPGQPGFGLVGDSIPQQMPAVYDIEDVVRGQIESANMVSNAPPRVPNLSLGLDCLFNNDGTKIQSYVILTINTSIKVKLKRNTVYGTQHFNNIVHNYMQPPSMMVTLQPRDEGLLLSTPRQAVLNQLAPNGAMGMEFINQGIIQSNTVGEADIELSRPAKATHKKVVLDEEYPSTLSGRYFTRSKAGKEIKEITIKKKKVRRYVAGLETGRLLPLPLQRQRGNHEAPSTANPIHRTTPTMTDQTKNRNAQVVDEEIDNLLSESDN